MPTTQLEDTWVGVQCKTCNLPEKLNCENCGLSDNLWTCLICGFVGCGRYYAKHAVSHNYETRHQFAQEISSQRIWNYIGDNYVHRMIRHGRLQEANNSTGAQ
jgi:BRCA1-associated protein